MGGERAQVLYLSFKPRDKRNILMKYVHSLEQEKTGEVERKERGKDGKERERRVKEKEKRGTSDGEE